MNELGTASRHAIGQGFDVMVEELDWIVSRMLGIDETALARAWMSKHSWKVPEALSDAAGVDLSQVGPERPAASLNTLVGEPSDSHHTGRENPVAHRSADMHTDGSPTRHLAAVPTQEV